MLLEKGRVTRNEEIRSGISHLKKRMEISRPTEIFEMTSILEAELPPIPAMPVTVDPESELDEQRWSVVSFERTEASGLTHLQAVRWMDELDLQGVRGLCIVTDEAALRVTT